MKRVPWIIAAVIAALWALWRFATRGVIVGILAAVCLFGQTVSPPPVAAGGGGAVASVTGSSGISVSPTTGATVVAPDTNILDTRANNQAGSDKYCADSSGSGTVKVCALAKALTAYTTGMVIQYVSTTSCTNCTLNIDGVAAVQTYESDGSTPATLNANQIYSLKYNGSAFVKEPAGSTGLASTACVPDASGQSICVAEDFMYATYSSSVVGAQWAVGGSGQTAAPVVGTWPHLGVAHMSFSSSATNWISMYYGTSSPINSFGTQTDMMTTPSTAWTASWVFRLGQTTNDVFYCGFGHNNASVHGDNRGVGIKYDTSASDTNFNFTSNNVNSASSVAADTNWHRLDLYWKSSGVLGMKLDGGTEVTACASGGGCTISASFTSENMAPKCGLLSGGSVAAGYFEADFFGFKAVVTR